MTLDRTSLLTRCIVSLSALFFIFLGSSFIMLPQLDARRAFFLPPTAWSWAHGSIFSLGITSFFWAALLVDLVRRCVALARRPAPANPTIPPRVFRIILSLTALIATLFAYYLVRSVHAASPLPASTKALWLVMLLGGQAVLAILAWWISHRGIGQGFAVLCALSMVSEIHECLSNAADSRENVLRTIGVAIFMAALTLFVLRPRSAKVADSPGFSRIPTSGLGPVILAFSLPSFVTLLALFGIIDARHAAAVTPGSSTFTVVASLFTIVMSVVLGYANHASMVHAADGQIRTAFWRSTWRTIPFALIFVLRPQFAGPVLIDPLSVVLFTAVIMDMGAELKTRLLHGDLVVITYEIDVHASDAKTWALRRANVAVLERGVFFAALTRFFGWLTPVELMVPVSCCEEALSVLGKDAGVIE